METRAVSRFDLLDLAAERLNVNGVCSLFSSRRLSPSPTTEFGPADASRFGDFEIAQRTMARTGNSTRAAGVTTVRWIWYCTGQWR